MRITTAASLDSLLDSILVRHQGVFRLQPLDDPARRREAEHAGDDRQPRLSRRAAPAPRCSSAKASSAWWPRRRSRSAFPVCCAACCTRTRRSAPRRMKPDGPPDRSVPLPGLENPASQLGVPLVVRGELIGVLCIESETPYRFHEEDKTTDRAARLIPGDCDPEHAAARRRRRRTATFKRRVSRRPLPAAVAAIACELTYYRGEEVVMLDGDYLIRSLPARILWKLLQTHKRGRPRRVHQSRAASRQVAQPAGLQGQPRDAAAVAAPPARSEGRGHPAGAQGPRPIRASARLQDRSRREGVTFGFRRLVALEMWPQHD